MSETAQSFTWTVGRAKADVQLQEFALGGIWQGNAPMGTVGLYVSIGQQSNTDVNTINAVRIFSSILLLIKAVSKSSDWDNIVIANNRIDALFQGQKNIALSPGYMLSSYREQEVSYEEVSAGIQYSHLGGLYRVLIQGA